MPSMGCQKLTYQNTETPLKVLYKKRFLNEKVLQLWLSVDPLASKYPTLSPYAYVANNPIMLVDPDGMRVKGAGFWRNFFKTDERIKAENDAAKHNVKAKKINGEWTVSYNEGVSKRINAVTFEGTASVHKIFKKPKRKSKSFGTRVLHFQNTINRGVQDGLASLDDIDIGEGSNAHTAAKVVANINPLVAVTSATRIFLGDGKDIHGVEADGGDKALAILDVATLGSSNVIKVLPTSLVSKGVKLMSKDVSIVNGFILDFVQGVKTTSSDSKKRTADND